MISTFYLGKKLVGKSADLPGYIPIGATIPSGFVSSEPNNPKNMLRITDAHVSVANGDVRYTVVPVL